MNWSYTSLAIFHRSSSVSSFSNRFIFQEKQESSKATVSRFSLGTDLFIELQLWHRLIANVIAKILERQKPKLLVKHFVVRVLVELLQVLVHDTANA